MLGLLDPIPATPLTAQLGVLILSGLTVLSAACWLTVLTRWSQGRQIFPAAPATEAPWGLSDLFIVTAIWLASMLVTALIAEQVFRDALPPPAPIESDASPTTESTAPQPRGVARPLNPMLFLISAACSLLACAASLTYLYIRFGAVVWSLLGFQRWKLQLGFGGFGFLLAMPPVIWLMSVLVRFFKYEHVTLDALAGSPTPAVIAATWISAGLVAPITEEFFFRYVLQSWLFRVRLRDTPQHRWSVLYGDSPPVAGTEPSGESPQPSLLRILLPILLSSFCFALMHAGQGPAPLALFVYALALGTVFYRTGSLIPCIVMHMLLNIYSLSLATSAALEAQ